MYDTKNMQICEGVYMCMDTYHPKKIADREFETDGSRVRFKSSLMWSTYKVLVNLHAWPSYKGPCSLIVCSSWESQVAFQSYWAWLPSGDKVGKGWVWSITLSGSQTVRPGPGRLHLLASSVADPVGPSWLLSVSLLWPPSRLHPVLTLSAPLPHGARSRLLSTAHGLSPTFTVGPGTLHIVSPALPLALPTAASLNSLAQNWTFLLTRWHPYLLLQTQLCLPPSPLLPDRPQLHVPPHTGLHILPLKANRCDKGLSPREPSPWTTVPAVAAWRLFSYLLSPNAYKGRCALLAPASESSFISSLQVRGEQHLCATQQAHAHVYAHTHTHMLLAQLQISPAAMGALVTGQGSGSQPGHSHILTMTLSHVPLSVKRVWWDIFFQSCCKSTRRYCIQSTSHMLCGQEITVAIVTKCVSVCVCVYVCKYV